MIAWFWSSVFVLLSVSMGVVDTAPHEILDRKRTERTMSDAAKRLRAQLRHCPPNVQASWTFLDIERAAPVLMEASQKTGLSFETYLKMIWRESGFYKYATHHNRDGSIDEGVSQQNSAYNLERCHFVTGRKCRKKQIFDIVNNLEMMKNFMIWCASEITAQRAIVTCYNSPSRARRGNFEYSDRVEEQYIYD